jgi:hypothetical protein
LLAFVARVGPFVSRVGIEMRCPEHWIDFGPRVIQNTFSSVEKVKHMLSKVAKVLLVATSIAPTLILMGINYFFTTKDIPGYFNFGVQLFAIAGILVGICIGIMWYASTTLSKQPFRVIKAKSSDKQVLTFLVAYLLPVMTKHDYLFRDFNLPTLALLLCLAVYHSNSFDFNPLLGVFGYHFYEVEGEDDSFPYLLISRRSLEKVCKEFTVVRLFDYTFLVVEK